jgi:hypothetical protein
MHIGPEVVWCSMDIIEIVEAEQPFFVRVSAIKALRAKPELATVLESLLLLAGEEEINRGRAIKSFFESTRA